MPESATEWIASASIEADPEKNHAANFDRAIPMFARNAAMMARLPPDALMSGSLGPLGVGLARLSRPSAG